MSFFYIISLIVSIFNCASGIYSHNISAALGWFCASMWLVVLLINDSETK